METPLSIPAYIYVYCFSFAFAIPVLLAPLILGFISDSILLTWLCIARRQIVRAGTILKEVFLLCVHLTVIVLVGLLFIYFFIDLLFDLDIGVGIGAVLLETLLSLYPLCVFVYMKYSSAHLPENADIQGILTDVIIEQLDNKLPRPPQESVYLVIQLYVLTSF